jgi:hypothetical protein
VINPGESRDFDITFTAGETLNYSGSLCITADSKCPVSQCIPLELTGNNKSIEWTRNSINFGLVKCNPYPVRDTLYIINSGIDPDSVTRIEILPDETSFSIVNKPSLPLLLNRADSLPVIIEYFQPNEGSFNAKLVFETASLAGKPVEIPLSGEFRRSVISPQDTTIDFGKVESCEAAVLLKQIYKNSGTIDETLVVDKSGLSAGFLVMSQDTIHVEAGKTADINLAFSPSDSLQPGIYQARILIHSISCPGSYSLNVKAEIIDPELVVSPAPLDYGSVFTGIVQPGLVSLINNSSIPRKITGIAPKNYKSNFIVKTPLPFVMQPGQAVNISIDFIAATTGSYVDSLVISSETACTHTDYAPVRAEVHEEIFDIIVRAGRYVRSSGDTLTVSLWLNHGIPKVEVSKIAFDLGFDRNLFSPVSVSARNNSDFSNLPFNYDFNSVSGQITGDIAAGLLKDSGAVINVKGIVLASMPDSTKLSVRRFDVFSPRQVNVTRQDGLLQVIGFCKPVVASRLALIPGFSASLSQQIISSQALDVVVNSTASMNIKVLITDLLGNKIRTFDFSLGKGGNLLSLDINGLSDGMYNITLSSEYNQVWHQKFIKTE